MIAAPDDAVQRRLCADRPPPGIIAAGPTDAAIGDYRPIGYDGNMNTLKT
jgi:hypothetical protein